MKATNEQTPDEKINKFLECQKARIKKLKEKYNIKTKKAG
jgi:hypothetical protein